MLALGPADEPVLASLRGQLALRRRDPAAAAHQFRLALDHNPGSREAVVALSVVLHLQGKEEESEALRKRADALRDLSGLLQEQFENMERGTRDRTLPRRLGAAFEAVGRPEVARSVVSGSPQHGARHPGGQGSPGEARPGLPLTIAGVPGGERRRLIPGP